MIDEELVNIIKDFIPSEAKYYVDEKDIAKAIIDDGYRKIVWHKVVDGDFPETYIDVLILPKNQPKNIQNKFIAMRTNSDIWFVNPKLEFTDDEVVAWTELPQYKELKDEKCND